MDALGAARAGDEIAHGFGLAAMVGGAVLGALAGAAVVAVSAATGGLAAVIIAGSVAGGGLSAAQLLKGLNTAFNLPEPSSGMLIGGSPNVFVNSRNAMRAGEDVAAACSGFPMNHPPLPAPVISATLSFNLAMGLLPVQARNRIPRGEARAFLYDEAECVGLRCGRRPDRVSAGRT